METSTTCVRALIHKCHKYYNDNVKFKLCFYNGNIINVLLVHRYQTFRKMGKKIILRLGRQNPLLYLKFMVPITHYLYRYGRYNEVWMSEKGLFIFIHLYFYSFLLFYFCYLRFILLAMENTGSSE